MKVIDGLAMFLGVSAKGPDLAGGVNGYGWHDMAGMAQVWLGLVHEGHGVPRDKGRWSEPDLDRHE